MQAIKTRYLPPTNTKPSRIKAECEAGTITISRDYSLNLEQLHIKAAYLLIQKLKWNPVKLYTGVLKDCYVHVLHKYDSDVIDMQNLPEFLKPQA